MTPRCLVAASLCVLAAAASLPLHDDLHATVARGVAAFRRGGLGLPPNAVRAVAVPHDAAVRALQRVARGAAAGRGFGALQAADCQSAEAVAALSSLQSACARIFTMTAANRSTALAGFCASACHTELSSFVSVRGSCFGNDVAFLKELVWRCTNTPQCFSDAYFG